MAQMLLADPSGALAGKCVRMALFLEGVSGGCEGHGPARGAVEALPPK